MLNESSAGVDEAITLDHTNLCTFGKDGDLAGISFRPIVIGGSEHGESSDLERRLAPELATGADAEKILRRFQRHSAELGTNIEISTGIGYLNI